FQSRRRERSRRSEQRSQAPVERRAAWRKEQLIERRPRIPIRFVRSSRDARPQLVARECDDRSLAELGAAGEEESCLVAESGERARELDRAERQLASGEPREGSPGGQQEPVREEDRARLATIVRLEPERRDPPLRRNVEIGM